MQVRHEQGLTITLVVVKVASRGRLKKMEDAGQLRDNSLTAATLKGQHQIHSVRRSICRALWGL